MIKDAERGAIAQLVEHLNGIEGVSGSNPLSSIQLKPACGAVFPDYSWDFQPIAHSQ